MNRYLIALEKLDRRRQMTTAPQLVHASVDELPIVEQNWEWVAKHLSQRIAGISERRAKDLVARNGGTAHEMGATRH